MNCMSRMSTAKFRNSNGITLSTYLYLDAMPGTTHGLMARTGHNKRKTPSTIRMFKILLAALMIYSHTPFIPSSMKQNTSSPTANAPTAHPRRGTICIIFCCMGTDMYTDNSSENASV